jgi:glutamyl-tRNA(Gln) amidotransferase subunit D
LSTGGTIASKVDYRTGAVTPILTAEELNSSVPELAEIANIDTEVLFSEYSENIMPEHWLKIAKKLEEYSNSNYSGIIIAHGTDTMHYTSSFLSFALAGYPIPIALVGSQRSSDRASSDAALNLIGATKFLVESKTKGIYVIMHYDESDETIACHFGTRVRKNHTSKRSAFQTVGDDPAYLIK